MMAAFCLGSQLAQRTQADKPELGETLPLWTIYGSSLSLSRSSHRNPLAVVSVFSPQVLQSQTRLMACALDVRYKVEAGLLDRHSHRRCSFLSFSFFFSFPPNHPLHMRPHPPPPPTPSSFHDRSDVGPTYIHLERSFTNHNQQSKRL